VLAEQESHSSEPPLLSIPAFFGHGTDDAHVGIKLGQQAAQVLSKVGLRVEWREYSGADQEEHWLKEPEELDDIARFLVSTLD
jgi:lysophospholipase-2